MDRLSALKLAKLPEEKRKEVLSTLSPEELEYLKYKYSTFDFWARDKQRMPEGDWLVWAIITGRGWGKNFAAGGNFHQRMIGRSGRRGAIIGPDPTHIREEIVEVGKGSFEENVHPEEMPEYQPSKRRITWPNGSVATTYSGEDPHSIRGFSGDTAWIDELAAFIEGKYNPEDTWRQIKLAVREAPDDLRIFITTTPRPIDVLKDIMERDDCVVTRGSSYDNPWTSETWKKDVLEPMEGTRFGKQEIHGHILDAAPNAYWNEDMIQRVDPTEIDFEEIVVGVDPAMTSKEGADHVGIVVMGKTEAGTGVVLDDRTMSGRPSHWAREVSRAYHEHNADLVVAEVNQGGELVENNITGVDPSIRYDDVVATSRTGDAFARAVPVSNLYEQNPPKIKHGGKFRELETMMFEYDPSELDHSPDRIDALVWCAHHLFITQNKKAKLRVGP